MRPGGRKGPFHVAMILREIETIIALLDESVASMDREIAVLIETRPTPSMMGR